MEPRIPCVVAAVFVALTSLCLHTLAVALPFWQVTAVSSGDITQGLWTTCLTDAGWSECQSFSSTDGWLLIVRTVEVMSLILLLLAIIAIFVYLLDIIWKDILHGMTVVTLLMVVLLIIIGLVIYGGNSPTGLHACFILAVIAAILALIAAILLLVGCHCCNCCPGSRNHGHQRNVIHRDSTIVSNATSRVIEREPTKAWSEDETPTTRNSSVVSWKSSSKIRPEPDMRSEYNRTESQRSKRTLTPVTTFHDSEKDRCCKCCAFFCLFSCCRCCRCGKRSRERIEIETTKEVIVCNACGQLPNKRVTYTDRSTSISSFQQVEMVTQPSTKIHNEQTHQTHINHVYDNKTENKHVVVMANTNGSLNLLLDNRSTCMTPEYEDRGRNRKGNVHKCKPVPCGRVIDANVFGVNQGPHSPCPYSMYCCRCKHTPQIKSKEKTSNEEKTGRSNDYLCDCQIGDIALCDKCIAKRNIKSDATQSKNKRQTPQTVIQNERVHQSNVGMGSKQTRTKIDNKKETLTSRVEDEKRVVFNTQPSSNDDSSEFHFSDNDNESRNTNKEDLFSDNDRDDVYNYVSEENDDDQCSNYTDEYSPDINGKNPTQSRPNGSKNPKAKRNDDNARPPADSEIPDMDDAKSQRPVESPKKDYAYSGRKPSLNTTDPPRMGEGKYPTSSRPNRSKNPKAKAERHQDDNERPHANGEIPGVDDTKPRRPPVRSPKKDYTNSGRKPSTKSSTSDPSNENTKPKTKPRILSHNNNKINETEGNTNRPKSESDANTNGPTDEPRKKKKHKWVPPQWKSHF